MTLGQLTGGLIVSVQAEAGSPLDTPETIAVLAQVAERNGAVAVRIESGTRIAATRRALRIPVIGIVKRAYPGTEPYITATEREVEEVLKAGAEIVAFDATSRRRPDGVTMAALVAAIVAGGAVAMADCAEVADARAAVAAGAAIVATTLCGYTAATRGISLPALELVRAIRAVGAFTVCEGGVASPNDLAAAFAVGADAVVVGTALTNLDVNVRRFVRAAREAT